MDEKRPNLSSLSRRDFLKWVVAALVPPLILGVPRPPAAPSHQPEVLKPPVTAPLKSGEFPKVKIDNIETFGDGAALDADQAQALVRTFNQENLQGSMDEKTHYSTEYVMETDYKEWKNRLTGIDNQSESYQSFLNRHNTEISRMLKECSPFLAGGLECRRLIVVKDEVMYGKKALTFYEKSLYRPLDSDGSVGGYITWPYNAGQSGWWDRSRFLDTGLIHEAFHGIMMVFDEYAIDTDFTLQGTNLSDRALEIFQHSQDYLCLPDDSQRKIKGLSPRQKLKDNIVTEENPGLAGIPTEWWTYLLSNRSDSRKWSIMANMSYRIGSFVGWALTRRVIQGWSHDYERRRPESSGWHYPAGEFSADNIIVLPEKYKGYEVQTWRTSGTYDKKNLNILVKSYTPGQTNNGEVHLGNPFSGTEIDDSGHSFIPSADALLYIKILDPDSHEVVAWRPMDVGDFCPVDNAIYGPPKELKMKMNFAEGDQTQKSFQWGINDKKIYFPIISK